MAAVLFCAILLLPGHSCAFVTYGSQVTYQTSDATSGDVTTTRTQERIRFFLNLSAKPTTNLSLYTNLSFDILGNQTSAGADSLQLQPALTLRLATPALKLGLGYRQILRDDNLISGNTTRSISDESSDLFADSNISVKNFPYLRLRFSKRDQSRDNNGVVTSDTTTDDVQGGVNYTLKSLSLNANYGIQRTTDRIAVTERELTQLSGTASFSKSLASWAQAILRGTFSLNKSLSDGATDSERSTASGEARLNTSPFDRTTLNTTYLYRQTEDLTTSVGATTDQSWDTSMSYAFPRFFRLYGKYNNRVTDDNTTETTTDIKIAGINFNHKIEQLNISAGYEKRIQDTTTVNRTQTERTLDRDLVNWSLTLKPTRIILLSLSESIVYNTVNENTNKTNRYRLRMTLGPIYNFTSTPFVDYTIRTPFNAPEVTTTQLIVPLDFRLDVLSTLSLQFTDNLTWRKEERENSVNTNQTNSAVLRLNWASLDRDLTVSGDASFSSSATDDTSTSRSSYSLRVNWRKSPHTFNTNFRYQTSSSRVDSASFSAQYGLSLRLKNLIMSFQTSYNYSITFSTPSSTSSSIFAAFSIRK